MHRGIIRGITSVLALAPTAALAHPSAGTTVGFVQGFAHPIGGLDHVLAMVAIGILAFQLGGRALWALPATFVTVMALGGLTGAAGVTLPYAEVGITLSVVVLGALIAARVKLPLVAAVTAAAVFAVFHGHAHGSEMPQEAVALVYGAGFMLATVVLHGAGLALGASASRIGQAVQEISVRAAGTAVAITGIVLVAGLM
jgi:urease accessory protein